MHAAARKEAVLAKRIILKRSVKSAACLHHRKPRSPRPSHSSCGVGFLVPAGASDYSHGAAVVPAGSLGFPGNQWLA